MSICGIASEMCCGVAGATSAWCSSRSVLGRGLEVGMCCLDGQQHWTSWSDKMREDCLGGPSITQVWFDGLSCCSLEEVRGVKGLASHENEDHGGRDGTPQSISPMWLCCTKLETAIHYDACTLSCSSKMLDV
jgi:hypothetical protein